MRACKRRRCETPEVEEEEPLYVPLEVCVWEVGPFLEFADQLSLLVALGPVADQVTADWKRRGYKHVTPMKVFETRCRHGLYKEDPEYASGFGTTEKRLSAFRMACAAGHLAVLKHLFALPEKPDVHAEDEWAFRTACMNGHLDVVKYLLSLSLATPIDVHAENEWAFRWACMYGYLAVVKYLLSLQGRQAVSVRARKEVLGNSPPPVATAIRASLPKSMP